MYQEEGYRLMGAAFEVYNQLGYGMAEEVYQQCLEIELELRGIPFLTKQELSLVYKGREIEKKYVPDLFVFEAIVVELKATKDLISDHEAQLFKYMHRTAARWLLAELRRQRQASMASIHPFRPSRRADGLVTISVY